RENPESEVDSQQIGERLMVFTIAVDAAIPEQEHMAEFVRDRRDQSHGSLGQVGTDPDDGPAAPHPVMAGCAARLVRQRHRTGEAPWVVLVVVVAELHSRGIDAHVLAQSQQYSGNILTRAGVRTGKVVIGRQYHLAA